MMVYQDFPYKQVDCEYQNSALYVIWELYYIVDQVQKLKLLKNNAEAQILITIRLTPYDLCPVI